jgi:predicted hydrocarbon binding protein
VEEVYAMEDRFVSNMTFRVVLLGIEEIIGKNGLNTVLNKAGLQKYRDNLPPNDHEKNLCLASEITRVDRDVADIFGSNGSAAILFQVGKMQAKWGLEENPDTVTAARSLLAGKSEFETARMALELAAAVVAGESDCKAWAEVDGADLLYNIDENTHSFGIKSAEVVCHVTSGFVTGIIQWATGKTDWIAREQQCMAQGAPHCTHRVKKGRE